MTEYYNSYFNKISDDENYMAVVAFVNTNNTCVKRDVAYIEYIEDNKWKKGIFKMTDDLKKIYFNYKNTNIFLNKRIKNIQHAAQNHSYIKILRDDKNPQLEGKIMIFKYGLKISSIITDYITKNQLNSIDDTFVVNINKKRGFINFDYCFFTNNKYKIEDYSLDILSDFNIKSLNLLNIDRK